jgi:tetratricopeptide (TPR) repeat protein
MPPIPKMRGAQWTFILVGLLVLSARSVAQTAAEYLNKGLEDQKAGHLDSAIADFDRAIVLNPDDAIGYFNRGLAKQAKKDWDGAIADFNRAIAMNPKYTDAYVNRGAAEEAKGYLDVAIADYNRAFALKSNDGAADKAMSDSDEVLADYDRAIALNPNYPDAYVNRGNAKRALNDLNGAIADYDRAIALDPNDSKACYGRGVANDARGDFAEARTDYAKCIRLNSKESDYARIRLALLLRRQNADEGPVGLAAAVAAWNDGWTRKVGLFLTGAAAESDLFSQAAIGTPQTIREHQCEADYYSGMEHLIKNELDKARDLFQKCGATGATDLEEFALAKAELARIAAEHPETILNAIP